MILKIPGYGWIAMRRWFRGANSLCDGLWIRIKMQEKQELSEGTFHLQWKFHIGKLIFMAWNDGNELACYRKENSIALASNRKATGTTMNTEIVLHSISVENLRHSCWTLFSGEMQNQGCNLFPSFRFHCLSVFHRRYQWIVGGSYHWESFRRNVCNYHYLDVTC